MWVGGWGLALLACGGAYWPLACEPSAMTSRHPYYCGHPPSWVVFSMSVPLVSCCCLPVFANGPRLVAPPFGYKRPP